MDNLKLTSSIIFSISKYLSRSKRVAFLGGFYLINSKMEIRLIGMGRLPNAHQSKNKGYPQDEIFVRISHFYQVVCFFKLLAMGSRQHFN